MILGRESLRVAQGKTFHSVSVCVCARPAECGVSVYTGASMGGRAAKLSTDEVKDLQGCTYCE